jgi:lysophospholipase L1-like esterase
MRPPSPARVLALAVAAAGVGVIAANLRVPDESVVLGVALLATGAAGLRWSGRRLRGAIEGLALLALVLGGGEITVRHENGVAARAYADRLMHFVDDPVLIYEWKPNVSCGVGTINALGMLDVPREHEKPAGTLRVACLGDSVGGDCELPRENACASLEGVLGAARGGRPVEALNFSVPGYNTMQEARRLEMEALAFSPDVIVVLYVMNDPYPDLAISHYLPGNFKFEHVLFSGAVLAAYKIAGPSLDPFGPWLTKSHEDPRGWNGVVVAGFNRIQAAAEARHIPVVVAVWPLFVAPTLPSYRAVYAKVTHEAERHGFIGVDLSDAAFRDQPLSELLKPSRDMIHPNAKAHRLAAEAISRALLERHPEIAR